MYYRDEEEEVQQMQMQSDTPPPVQPMKLQPAYQFVQQIPPSPFEQQRLIVPSAGINININIKLCIAATGRTPNQNG